MPFGLGFGQWMYLKYSIKSMGSGLLHEFQGFCRLQFEFLGVVNPSVHGGVIISSNRVCSQRDMAYRNSVIFAQRPGMSLEDGIHDDSLAFGRLNLSGQP